MLDQDPLADEAGGADVPGPLEEEQVAVTDRIRPSVHRVAPGEAQEVRRAIDRRGDVQADGQGHGGVGRPVRLAEGPAGNVEAGEEGKEVGALLARGGLGSQHPYAIVLFENDLVVAARVAG